MSGDGWVREPHVHMPRTSRWSVIVVLVLLVVVVVVDGGKGKRDGKPQKEESLYDVLGVSKDASEAGLA